MNSLVFRISRLSIFHWLSSTPDWKQAAKYYEKYIALREKETTLLEEEDGTSESNPAPSSTIAIPFHEQHDVVARLAYLYKTGGHDLECHYQRSGTVSAFPSSSSLMIIHSS